jgi:hypothetical protein
MPILGIVASSRLTSPVPITGFFQIATDAPTGSSLTFSSIPSTYDHLQIHAFSKDSRSPVYSSWGMQFNGDSGNNYNYASPQIDSRVSGPFAGNAITANGIPGGAEPGNSASSYRAASVAKLFDYRNTNKYTTVLAYGGYVGFGDGSTEQGIVYPVEGMWVNTAAVTSITILSGGGNFQAGTRFSLYGIKGS